jgi:hypothetical protein
MGFPEPPTSGPGSWHPGERGVLLRASHGYRFVLLLICALFVFTATRPDDAVAALGFGRLRPGDGRDASLRLYFS